MPCVPGESGPALPVGWDENVAPKFFRGIASGREDGQTDTKNAEPVLLAPHEVSR
jgi:hypothetical protein